MKRILTPLLTAVLGTALFTGLLFVDFYKSLDSRLYDLLLRIKPAIEEDESIILLEVDDQTISEVDMYPLGRDIFADGLILMKEFGPAWTMLDIEFVDRSPAGINLNYLDYDLSDEVYGTMDMMMQYNAQLIDGLISGTIGRQDALDFLEDLKNINTEESRRLYEAVRGVAFDKDIYLGKAIDYLGDVSVTINMTEDYDPTVTQEQRDYALEHLTVNDSLTLTADPFDEATDILPSIMPVTESAAWAGFPRMHIDSDGVRRRVDVLYSQDGNYFTHMGFGTWWIRQGCPPITAYKNKIVVGDVEIPLDRDGKMLINWPKRFFDGTPLNRKKAEGYDPGTFSGRLSFFYLYYHDLILKEFTSIIEELEYYGLSSDIYGETSQPLSMFAADLDGMRSGMLESGDGSRAEEYGGYRNEYFSEARRFLESDAKSLFLDDLDFALSDPDTSEDDAAYFEELLTLVPTLFEEALWRLDNIQAIRDVLSERLKDSTVVIGYSGTSTSDYGANPFEKQYMNMGIYGAVYNSFIKQEFLSEAPLWLTAVILLGSGLIITFLGLVGIKRSELNTTLGLILVVLILAASGAVFVYTGVYINMLSLLLVLISTYLASIIGNFLAASRERTFIQNAFGQIISPDVVKEIQQHPDMLSIKGQTRQITAMFTDIEKFSTITEHLGTTDRLFEFLQRYLTPMSDIILEEHGTIDKYEGDAIIAFWSAPIDQEDHAHRACRAAMRMARLEREISDDLKRLGFLSDEILSILPHGRLFTRIGINTGENNVGFIGTERRKDYTALGDNMNLAARLEGVNKLYNTQVLISGATESIIHSEFITRRLDRIRVVGRDTPVGMYELSYSKDFPEDFPAKKREGFNLYRDALELFWKKKWDDSEKLFNKVLTKLPEDGPTQVFIERCQKYRKNPPPTNWDGVYKMEFK